MKRYFFVLFTVSMLYACADKVNPDNPQAIEIKARQLIDSLDESSISFLKEWNYTRRAGTYNVWTKVKNFDSLEYSMLYQPFGDTIYIEIYDLTNFQKDYECKLNFDTAKYDFYGFAKVKDRIFGVFPDGKVVGRNLLDSSIFINSVFPAKDPFAVLQKVDRYKKKFNLESSDATWCQYSPEKGNFIRFVFSANDHFVLYYLPDTLKINDSNMFPWIDKFSRGKRMGKNWIYLERDSTL